MLRSDIIVIELFLQPTLMHNFLYSLTICLLHYYPRHVSNINMPLFRRKNCIHTASGIFALRKRLPSTLVESGLLFIILDMFRALTWPSSGGKIVFTQHLVSSLSVNVCTVHWLRADCSVPVYCANVYRERRYQMLCEYNFSSWRGAC